MARYGFHKWVVLTITIIIAIVCLGSVIGFGAFFPTLLELYGESRSYTALIQALYIGCTLMFGVISGSIVAKLGIPKSSALGAVLFAGGFIVSFFATSILFLVIAVGIVSGFGISLLFISSTAAIGECFDGSLKVLAVSLQSVGISVGGIIFPMFAEWSVDMYGFHGTMLVFGAFGLNLVVSAIIFYYSHPAQAKSEIGESSKEFNHLDTENTHESIGSQETKLVRFKNYLSEWVTIPYVLILLAICLNNGSLNGIIGIIVDIFSWKGHRSEQGLDSLTVINITGLVFRLVPGLTKQIAKKSNSCLPPALFGLLGTAGIVVMVLGSSYPLLMVGCGLLGAPFGGCIASTSILVVKLSPMKHLAVAVGLMMTTSGLVSTVSGPIFGALYDSSSSYTVVLMVVGVSQLLSAMMYLLALRARHSAKPQTSIPDDVNNIVVTKL